MGRLRVLQAAAAAADGVGHGLDRLVLADHRWWMRSSITSSLARSVSIMRLTGMPVQALTTSAISSSVDFLAQQPPFGGLLAARLPRRLRSVGAAAGVSTSNSYSCW